MSEAASRAKHKINTQGMNAAMMALVESQISRARALPDAEARRAALSEFYWSQKHRLRGVVAEMFCLALAGITLDRGTVTVKPEVAA